MDKILQTFYRFLILWLEEMMGDKSTVLIVDDVRENIQVLGNLLEKQNINIVATNESQKAIQVANQITIDLIL